MLHVSVDLSEFERLRQQTITRIRQAVVECVADGAKAGESHAKGGRWQDRTGRLRREIEARPYSFNINGAEWDITSPTPYAPFVEYGTKPHWIRPKFSGIGPMQAGQSRRSKTDIGTHRVALRWIGPDGQAHFARAVFHPGTQPIPFMAPAGEVAGDEMVASFERRWANIVSIWN
jgi:hypothetical protein